MGLYPRGQQSRAGAPTASGWTIVNEELLNEFVQRLQQALADDLVSVVLYGSAVTGDFHEKFSNLNVLGILTTVGPSQLERAYEPIDWWLKKKQPSPVLLSVEEIDRAPDAFAIEFLDIRAAYRVLYGKDLVASIEVKPEHHRHQVEHELRSRLLRLRERYLALQKDRRAVIQLLVDSLPTFATLFRHTLLLSGGQPPVKKREIFREAAQRLSISAEPFETLLDVREGKRRLADPEIRPVFDGYLREITRTVEYVDRL
jgi:predicted nucleotidyltransferase